MRDRRCNPRVPLDDMLYLTLRADDRELHCVLLDISICGARLGVPPNEPLPAQQTKVVFMSAAPLEALLDGRTAAVVWGHGVQFGVRFTEKLPVHLEKISEILNSAIFY